MIIRHYKLPKKKFLCKVPLISTYEPEMLELLGLPQAIDNQGNQFDIYNNMTMVMIDIDRMIELYKTGYRIAVLKKSDATEIYNILERYYYDIEDSLILFVAGSDKKEQKKLIQQANIYFSDYCERTHYEPNK